MWTWLKKYWWAVAGGIAGVVWAVVSALSRRPSGASESLRKARDEADKIRAEARRRLDAQVIETTTKLNELDEASEIPDERARLQALADIANRNAQ